MKSQKYLIFIQYYFHSVNFPPNKYRNIIIFGVSLRFCCHTACVYRLSAPVSPAPFARPSPAPPFARRPLPRSFCPAPFPATFALCSVQLDISNCPLPNCPLPSVRRTKKGRASPPLLYIMCSPNYFAGSFSPCCSISRLAQMNGPTPFPSLSRMGSLI